METPPETVPMTRVCSNINSRARHFTYPLDHGVLILVATFDSPKIHQRPSQRVDTCLSVVALPPRTRNAHHHQARLVVQCRSRGALPIQRGSPR